MRIFVVSAVIIAALCAAPVVEAGPIGVGDVIRFQDGAGTTGGGEFLVTVNDLESFITFCLQRTEYIDYSTHFVVGGVSPFASSDDAAHGGDGSGHDPLSSQTAWLYTAFRAGSLTGYDYDGVSRWQSANDLQNAIWWFEDELLANPNNAFVTAANSAVLNGWSGIGRVRALNLEFPDGREAQDQLALTPVPEPATLTLFGSALALIGWRKRRSLWNGIGARASSGARCSTASRAGDPFVRPSTSAIARRSPG